MLHQDMIDQETGVLTTHNLFRYSFVVWYPIYVFYSSGLSVSRRIVDSEGWEKLGLYEYYRAKNQARKRKEEDIIQGLREKSRSPSPIYRPPSREKSPTPKKRYRRYVQVIFLATFLAKRVFTGLMMAR